MEDQVRYGLDAPCNRNCGDCIKRGVCEPRSIMARFVTEYGPKFECGEFGFAAIGAWQIFLASRCREYEDEKEVSDESSEND